MKTTDHRIRGVLEAMPGRYVVYGAGAIGGTIGARLHQAGHEVVLIARGRHLKALRGDGLRLQTPDADRRLAIPTVGSPRETEIGHEDVVLLTMKSQDTAAALEELRPVADPDAAVACAQNGVENERLALRYFAHVYGVFVWISAQHLEPGVVQAFAAGALGVVDLGRAPHGIDRLTHKIASDLQGAGFAARTDPEIMSWKYAKLLSNLGNAVEALLGPDAPGGELVRRARGEALACFAAAGIQCVTEAEVRERVGTNEELRPVNGKERQGGSSWQSLGRGSGSIETDYLNGEIVQLGRIHGVPTPVNHALTQIAGRMASDGAEPGSADPLEIQATIEQLGG